MVGGGGGSQRLLSLIPTTVKVVLLLGLWLLMGCDNTNIVANIDNIEGGNIAIKSAKNICPAGNSSIELPMERPENMIEVSRVKSVSSVVRLLNPKNILSPKSYKKRKFTIKRKEKRRYYEEYLERKKVTMHNNQAGKSNANMMTKEDF